MMQQVSLLSPSSFTLGTCINNTSVMMFKKGSFEIGGDMYPVAIKARLISMFFYYSVYPDETQTSTFFPLRGTGGSEGGGGWVIL